MHQRRFVEYELAGRPVEIVRQPEMTSFVLGPATRNGPRIVCTPAHVEIVGDWPAMNLDDARSFSALYSRAQLEALQLHQRSVETRRAS